MGEGLARVLPGLSESQKRRPISCLANYKLKNESKHGRFMQIAHPFLCLWVENLFLKFFRVSI